MAIYTNELIVLKDFLKEAEAFILETLTSLDLKQGSYLEFASMTDTHKIVEARLLSMANDYTYEQYDFYLLHKPYTNRSCCDRYNGGESDLAFYQALLKTDMRFFKAAKLAIETYYKAAKKLTDLEDRWYDSDPGVGFFKKFNNWLIETAIAAYAEVGAGDLHEYRLDHGDLQSLYSYTLNKKYRFELTAENILLKLKISKDFLSSKSLTFAQVESGELAPISAVYLVYQGDRLLYVGKADKVKTRLNTSHHNWLAFSLLDADRVDIVATDPGNLSTLEESLILKLNPMLNNISTADKKQIILKHLAGLPY